MRFSLVTSVMILQTGCSSLLNSLVLFPTHDPIPTVAERETIKVEGLPGRAVELYYQEFGASARAPDVYVLSLTGNGGRAEFMPEYSARLLTSWWSAPDLEIVIGVLALQYPGYGSDQGPASLDGNGQAAVAALAHLRQRAGDKPVVVHGLSLGSATALHLGRTAGRESVQGLILEKPPNLRSMILWRYGWWNLWLLAGPVALAVPESALSDRNAAAIESIPALFVVAENDQVVPPAYSRDIFKAYGGPCQVIESTTHHNGGVTAQNAPGLLNALDWLANHVLPEGS